MMRATTTWALMRLNAYWLGLSFLWTSLHVLLLPALLLQFVPEHQKNTALGLMTFSGLVVAMLVQPLAGGLSDRWGSRFGRRRPFIAGGTLADLIFLSLLAVAGGVPAVALAYLGLQFTSNLAHGPAQGLMHDLVPPERMGWASGLKNLFDMGGMVVASLLIGRIYQPETRVASLALIAGVLLLSAAVTLLGTREGHSKPQPNLPLRAIFRIQTPAFRGLISARLVFLIGVYGIQTFAQYFVRDALAAADPVRLTGDLMAAIVLSLMLFSLLAGRLADRLGRKPLHAVAAALMALGSLLLMSAHTATQVLIYGALTGAGIGTFLSANWALANDLAPGGQGGRYLGLTNLATAGAAALSRLMGPAIDALNNLQPGDNLGYRALFLFAAALSLASLAILRRVPEPLRAPARP